MGVKMVLCFNAPALTSRNLMSVASKESPTHLNLSLSNTSNAANLDATIACVLSVAYEEFNPEIKIYKLVGATN